jgi:hypothetical protein
MSGLPVFASAGEGDPVRLALSPLPLDAWVKPGHDDLIELTPFAAGPCAR